VDRPADRSTFTGGAVASPLRVGQVVAVFWRWW